jgi:general secretion pathway protein E
MIDLGAQPVSIGPALRLVIAQRLVRKLCEKCKTAKPIDTELKARITKFLARMPDRLDKKMYEAATQVYEAKVEGDKKAPSISTCVAA